MMANNTGNIKGIDAKCRKWQECRSFAMISEGISRMMKFLASDSWVPFCVMGSAIVFSFAPFYVFIFAIASFAWLFARLIDLKVDLKTHLKRALLFLYFMHLFCLYWMLAPMTIEVEKHWIMIPLALTVMPIYFSAFLMPAVLCLHFMKGMNLYQKALGFSAALSFFMFVGGNYAPGFPWLLPGYIWSFSAIMMQSLCIYGIYGLTFLTLVVSTLLGTSYEFYKNGDQYNSRKSAYISLFICAILFLFGFCRLYNHETEFTKYSARMIQCNLTADEKNFRANLMTNLKTHVKYSQHKAHIDFVIWPETAIPYIYYETYKDLNDILKTAINSDTEFLISGAVREDQKTKKVFNSIIAVDFKGKMVFSYDKVRLVPFGEYVPLRRLIPFSAIASSIGDFDVGNCITQPIVINGLKIIPAICYEAVFPSDFVPFVCTKAGESSAAGDIILNLTNDAWFVGTIQPFQHLEIVRARAIEHGVPLIRSTNYGISAVFDAYGIEIGRIPFNKIGVMDFDIPTNINNGTLYDKYRDNLFLFMLSFICFLLIIAYYSGNRKKYR